MILLFIISRKILTKMQIARMEKCSGFLAGPASDQAKHRLFLKQNIVPHTYRLCRLGFIHIIPLKSSEIILLDYEIQSFHCNFVL